MGYDINIKTLQIARNAVQRELHSNAKYAKECNNEYHEFTSNFKDKLEAFQELSIELEMLEQYYQMIEKYRRIFMD